MQVTLGVAALELRLRGYLLKAGMLLTSPYNGIITHVILVSGFALTALHSSSHLKIFEVSTKDLS